MLVVKRDKEGFSLSDKAMVLERYYSYMNLNRYSTFEEFYKESIDTKSDLTLEEFKSWVYPCSKKEGIRSEDKVLLESMAQECESVSLLSTITSLMQKSKDKTKYEKALDEASRVSKEAKEIIIQEYLDSIAHKVA